MKQYTIEPDLRRFDIRDKSIEMLYLVNLSEEGSLDKIVKAIKSTHPDAGVTFLDQNNLPGV